MKNKILYPFAFTALFAALSGCGGESANVIPEQNDEATTNGSCSATATNCLEWGLNIQLMVLILIVVVIKKIPLLLYLTKMMGWRQVLVKSR